jgi:hypothetical protein
MYEEQNGRCAICQKFPLSSKTFDLYVDHDHKTGKVRHLLCMKCNALLGMCNDDQGILLAALEYLMDTETESDAQARQTQEAEAQKLSQGFMLRRYKPVEGRADRMAANIPGFKGENS